MTFLWKRRGGRVRGQLGGKERGLQPGRQAAGRRQRGWDDNNLAAAEKEKRRGFGKVKQMIPTTR